MGRIFIKYRNPMPSFYVKRLGYELEGGFNEDVAEYNDEEGEYMNGYFKEDGSVSCANYIEGEIASPVFYCDELGFKNMSGFIRKNMPDEVNDSCGHHVHISFNNLLAYQKLMDEPFRKAFKNAVIKYFRNNTLIQNDGYLLERFEKRIKGIEYCYKDWSPNSQANPNGMQGFDGSRHGRYTQLNFPFSTHGTLECRLFPASDNADIVININKWFVNFVNDYLNTLTYERTPYDNMKIDNDHDIKIEDKIFCV